MFDREKISRLLVRSGLLHAVEQLPSTPGVVVFNHHRIGEPEGCGYDRDLYSATAEQFDYQLSYLKKQFPVLLPCELADILSRKTKLKRMHAVISFDDGYLDNYTLAFPLLKMHGLRAAFFLVSSFVGTSFVPWWDEIAYLVRHTQRSSLEMRLGKGTTVQMGPDRDAAIVKVIGAYRSKENRDTEEFLRNLRDQVEVELPMDTRRFLNWDEAREMAAAGMEIGAHSHSHPFLGRLPLEEQEMELSFSKRILEQHMGAPVTSLAYPIGSMEDFTVDTQKIAEEAGYTTAFSFYGGINSSSGGERYNILRGMPDPHPGGFRVGTVLLTRLGRLEPVVRKTYRRFKYGRVTSYNF